MWTKALMERKRRKEKLEKNRGTLRKARKEKRTRKDKKKRGV